jgi:hypothetical protein
MVAFGLFKTTFGTHKNRSATVEALHTGIEVRLVLLKLNLMQNQTQGREALASFLEILRNIFDVYHSINLCGNNRAALLDCLRHNGVISGESGVLLALKIGYAVSALDQNDVPYAGFCGLF